MSSGLRVAVVKRNYHSSYKTGWKEKLFPPPRRDAGVAFIFESALGGSRSSKRRTKPRRPDEPDGHGRKAEHGVAHKVWALAVATPRDVQHGYVHIAVVIY